MKKKRIPQLFALCLSVFVSTHTSDSSDLYKIDSYTLNGGGGSGSGGPYKLTGTLGQPDTGNGAGSTYAVEGGFYPGTKSRKWDKATLAANNPSPFAGQLVVLTGRVTPGAPGARIYFDGPSGQSMGLTEVPVDADGNFRIEVEVPRAAVPGISRFSAHAIGSTGIDLTSFDIEIPEPAPQQIRGTLASGDGEKLAGRQVRLLSSTGIEIARVAADESGLFEFANVNVGDYRVDAGTGFSTRPVSVLPNSGATDALIEALGLDGAPYVLAQSGAVVRQGGAFTESAPQAVADQTNDPFFRSISLAGREHAPLNVRFWVTLNRGNDIIENPSVTFQFKGWNGGQFMNATDERTATFQRVEQSPFDFDAYTADFNVHDIPAFASVLIVTATGDQAGAARTETFSLPVEFENLAPRWLGEWTTATSIAVQSETFERYVGGRRLLNWDYAGSVPSPIAFHFDEPIDLGIIEFENRLEFGIRVEENFSSLNSWSGTARPNAELIVLDYEVFSESPFDYSGPHGSSLDSSIYSYSRFPLVETKKFCVKIPSLSTDLHTCLDLGFWEPCIGGKVTTQFCLQGRIDFETELDRELKPTALVTPALTASVPIEAVLDGIICSGRAFTEPNADLSLPILVDPDLAFPFVEFQSPCLRINARLDYSFSCLGFEIFDDAVSIDEVAWGCAPQGLLREPRDNHKNELAPLQSPTVASNGAGEALSVWVEHGKTDLKPHLRWSHFVDGEWSEPLWVVDESHVAEAPQVAFIAPNIAVAVWVESNIDPSELNKGEEVQFMNELEMRFATWSEGKWSPPENITTDQFLDARPVLAGSSTLGQASLVWLRYQVGEQAKPLQLVHATFDGQKWTKPTIVDKGTGLDWQQTIAYAPSGDLHLAFTRDADGDVRTLGDRNLMYTTWNGADWNTAAVLPGLPLDPYTPSLAVNANGDPAIAFVAPPVDKKTGEVLTGDGNSSELWLVGKDKTGAWRTHSASTSLNAPVYAERPVAKFDGIDGESRVLVVARRFGEEGDNAHMGSIAVGTIDLNKAEPKWQIQNLSDNGLVNREAAFDFDSTARESFILSAQKSPGLGLEDPNRLLDRKCIPYGSDLQILPDDIRFSKRHPLAGETVKITAEVLNVGFEKREASEPVTVKFYSGNPDAGGKLIGSAQLPARDLGLGEKIEVDIDYEIPKAGLETISVVLESDLAETKLDNNVTHKVLGEVDPPKGIKSAADATQEHIGITWQQPETADGFTYRIFRSTTGDAEDFEFVGTTKTNRFTDMLTLPEVTYTYMVEAISPAGTTSQLSQAASAKWSPPETPTIEDLPDLDVRLETKEIVVSWPAAAEGIAIEQALGLEKWEAVPEPESTNGVSREIRIPRESLPQSPIRFFRLRRR